MNTASPMTPRRMVRARAPMTRMTANSRVRSSTLIDMPSQPHDPDDGHQYRHDDQDKDQNEQMATEGATQLRLRN